MNLFLLLPIIISLANATVIDLTSTNFKTVLDSNELVLVDFYASWCYFSNVLDPIFTDASNSLEAEYKDQGKVALAKVDCEKETDLSSRYGIRKYPTIKLFRFGEISKHEYRGARSVSAFTEYIKQQLSDPVVYMNATDILNKEMGVSYVIGYFKDKSGDHLKLFRKIAHQFSDDCKFVAKITPDIENEKFVIESNEKTKIEMDKLDKEDEVKDWVVKSCMPVVRNITFQNAEDITEEGLPLVLLFYNPSNPDITVKYSKFVAEHLMQERKIVNFVFADGQKFAHPLAHLGKSDRDLPLIAIDSFQHMFLLPGDVEENLKKPEIFRKFIGDLQSGKLHREFHNGPDPEPGKHIDSKYAGVGDSNGQPTTPIPSVFKKLKPNSNRYTLFHDEF